MSDSMKQSNIAWFTAFRAFQLFSEGKEEEIFLTNDLLASLNLLSSQGLSHVLKAFFIDSFQKVLQNEIVPNFWKHFDQDGAEECFPQAVQELYLRIKSYSSLTQRLLLETCSEEMEQLLRARLLMSLQLNFHNPVIHFYSRAFKVYVRKNKDIGDTEDVFPCSGCDKDAEHCVCQNLLRVFELVNQQLSELQLLKPLVGDAVLTVAQRCIEDYVQENCKGNFGGYKEKLEKWLEESVFIWLQWIFCKEAETLNSFRGRLLHYLDEMYATVRMEQLFNIIIEFPESNPALEDLCECLERTNLRPKLIGSLKRSLEVRLLHPGAKTSDILTAYISAIKALRVLDPAGVILQLACEPVCKYLRSREDTVRCIVSSLIDDNCEFGTELMSAVPVSMDDSCCSDEDGDWESWQPDPIDADPGKAPKSHRSSDIISMLVNIYGTKELFVKEYQTLLSTHLLTKFVFDTERDIRNLELLKLRFGESLLHFCEVMLRDVADSKRINAHVNASEHQAEFPISAMVVSAQFWPVLREEKFELPQLVQTALEGYTRAFETLKGNRTLCWKPALGLVNLEVTLKDRTVNVMVSPIQFAILWHFQEKSKWTIEDLSLVLRASTSVVRRRITVWQCHGVLREEGTDTFVLEEERQGSDQEGAMAEEEEMEVMTASSQEQKEEEIQKFWSFIVGMLTNLESLPLEQIHTMLHMFAMQGPSASEWSVHQLRQFLGQKVSEDKLVFSNGVYRLPP